MLTVEQARAFYISEDAVHDFEHVQRVYHNAMKLGKAEGADLEILQAAALLHDVRGAEPGGAGRAEHHVTSALFAEEVLMGKGWPVERIRAVQHAIRAHRYRGKEDQPETIEAKVLFDSDKLDVIGAIGAARA
ncbi:MAG: HD domain-containing protein, partial [Leptolinea sp.]